MSDENARKLAYATFAGAIKLAQASDESPATLRAQVTSKGGTTERALSVLDEHEVKAKFVAAVKAAAARAKELGDELGHMADQVIKYLLDVVFGLFTYALLLRFAMQTLRAPFRNPVGQAVIALTDWIVKPLRRVLPGFKGIDWASLVATILFQFLWMLAYSLIFGSFSLLGTGIAFLLARHRDRARARDPVAPDRGGARAGDPVVGRARRSAVGSAQRAHVSVPAADPQGAAADRRHARSVAARRDRDRAAPAHDAAVRRKLADVPVPVAVSAPWRREEPGALVLTLHVQPGAKRTEVAGVHGDALKLRLAAPPVEGKANAELLRFLADEFGVPVRQATLVRGQASRAKWVRIERPRLRPDLDW